MSSRLGLGVFSSSSTAVISMPGVQKPHCRPCFSQNASCSGCMSSTPPRPSMVRTSDRRRPERRASGRSARPRRLTRTVQAPQTPCSQPTWVPVSPRLLAQEVAQQRARLGLALGGGAFAIDDKLDCAWRRHLRLPSVTAGGGVGERAPGQAAHQIAPIVRVRMKVFAGVDAVRSRRMPPARKRSSPGAAPASASSAARARCGPSPTPAQTIRARATDAVRDARESRPRPRRRSRPCARSLRGSPRPARPAPAARGPRPAARSPPPQFRQRA